MVYISGCMEQWSPVTLVGVTWQSLICFHQQSLLTVCWQLCSPPIRLCFYRSMSPATTKPNPTGYYYCTSHMLAFFPAHVLPQLSCCSSPFPSHVSTHCVVMYVGTVMLGMWMKRHLSSLAVHSKQKLPARVRDGIHMRWEALGFVKQ